ncbi:3-deoxy-D-manno-octulosonic acid transferase [Candidatus Pelagibacter sp. HIMB1485]|uniref:3-deoxy-D-manno-octulosonic acid transferase n=1 Tax=Candidatus Pelagibacter sp. HIMB1485 TaxID=3415415 RepID=UPI003F854D21
MFFVYGILTNVLFLLSPLIFFFRILKKKEDLYRFQEKYCIYSKRNFQKTIWFHAVSVGELMSIIPVINKLEKNKKIKKIIVTSSTTSSAKVFKRQKFKKTIHKFFPLDTNFLTKKFINIWKPEVAIFVDSEIWPNMIKNLNKKQIPIILLNARLTKSSFEKWLIVKSFAKEIFGQISIALPQNIETKKYLKILGIKKMISAGNIKYFGEKILLDNKSSKFSKQFKKFKILCAGSTHNSEEILIAKLHIELKKILPNLLTVLIPRHINRSENIINDLNKFKLNVVKHSTKQKISKKTDIYLVDTFGETKNFYNLSNIAFLGGSIVNHGGQNPLEAARLGNYIINGPNIDNFTEIYNYLKINKMSYTTSNILKMRDIVLSKINKKRPLSKRKKIFDNGNKILDNNIRIIEKYIQ